MAINAEKDENSTAREIYIDRLLQHENRVLNNFRKRELLFKVLVLGDFGVGKTSIIRRYADGTFCSSYKTTIGADFAIKPIEWDNDTRVTLQLWDIAGHERFGYLTGVYYRYAVAAAIVFDLTRPETFRSVEKWLNDLRRKVNLPGGQPVPVVILANKGDVSLDCPNNIEEFCTKYNIHSWLITSAKENVSIDDAFLKLLQAAIENLENLQISTEIDRDIVKLGQNEPPNTNNRKLCCQR